MKVTKKVSKSVDIQKAPNTLVLEKATKLVSEEFGLDNTYFVNGFAVKPNEIKIVLSNKNFEVTTVIKGEKLHLLQHEVAEELDLMDSADEVEESEE